MIDLWNKSNKENHVLCYGFNHKENVNDFSNYSKATEVFRAREVRNRQNINYDVSDVYKKNKNLIFLETGDHIENLEKDDIVIYAGRKLIIEEKSTKIDNQQTTFAYYKPSATTLLICRGNI